MTKKPPGTAHGRWAEFRFGVVGSLLSAHPVRGELEQALQALAKRIWTHPITGDQTPVPRMHHRALVRRGAKVPRRHPWGRCAPGCAETEVVTARGSPRPCRKLSPTSIRTTRAGRTSRTARIWRPSARNTRRRDQVRATLPSAGTCRARNGVVSRGAAMTTAPVLGRSGQCHLVGRCNCVMPGGAHVAIR